MVEFGIEIAAANFDAQFDAFLFLGAGAFAGFFFLLLCLETEASVVE